MYVDKPSIRSELFRVCNDIISNSMMYLHTQIKNEDNTIYLYTI